MAFADITGALEKGVKKLTGGGSDDDKDKKEKEKDEHKDPPKDQKQGANTNGDANHELGGEHHEEGVAEKLVHSAWSFAELSVHKFGDIFTSMSSAPIDKYANTGFHLTDSSAPKDGTTPTVKPTETPAPGNPFDYDSWFNIWKKTGGDKPAEQPRQSLAEKVSGWVGTQWDKFFGNGKAGEFEGVDDKGNKTKTTMSDRGVDHVSEDGSKLHADGKKVVTTDGDGNTFGFDKETGDGRYEQKNGLVSEKHKDGSVDMKDKNGNEVHIARNGDITYEHDGHQYHVNGRKAVHMYNGARWQQYRQGNAQEQEQEASRRSEDGKPQFTTISDPEDPSHRIMIINDGDGNTMKLRGNGDVILSNKDNPGLELVSNQKTHETRVRIDGQEYFMQHQKGTDGEDRWYLYKSKDCKAEEVFGWIGGDGQVFSYDPNDKSQTGKRLGELKGLHSDGTMSNGAATLGTDGHIQSNIEGTQIDQRNMRVTKTGPDGKTQMQITETGVSQLSNVTPDGQHAETSDMDPHGRLVTKHDVPVDAQTGQPKYDANGIADGGTIETDSKIDPQTGKMITQINEGDGTMMTVTSDPNNPDVPPEVQFANGAGWDSNGDFHDTKGNVVTHTGAARMADGTEVDEYGNVSYNGKYMGTSGGFNNGDGATAARVNAILGLAESLRGNPNPDPGKIAFLLSLYDALTSAGACALANNDVGGFIHADLAKACVSGAITDAQAAEARTQLAQYFTDHPLTTDQIVQIQHHMSGVSTEEIKQFAERNHLTAHAAAA